MPMQRNPYYADPNIARAVSNIGNLLFGDPDRMVRDQLYVAQGIRAKAAAEADMMKAQREQAAFDARSNLGDKIFGALFRQEEAPGPNIDGSAGYQLTTRRDPQQVIQNLAPVLNSVARGYDNAAAMGQIFQLIGAMTGDDSLARQGMVAAGHTPGENFALTSGRADAISARDATESQRQAESVANINNAGAMARQNAQPVNASEGDTVIFAPGDSRAAQPGVGQIFAVPAKPRADRFVVTPRADGQGFEYQPVAPGLAAPDPNKTGSKPETLASQIKGDTDLLGLVDQMAGAIYDKNGNLVDGGIDLAPDLRAVIARRANEMIKKGANPSEAVAVALDELTVVENPWIGNKRRVLKPAAPAAAAPQATPAAVPPPAQRQPGKVYQTPKGPMIWTGTGWRPAGAPDA